MFSSLRTILWSVVPAFSLCAGALWGAVTPTWIGLTNSHLRITLDSQSGALVEFADVESGHNFNGAATALWEMRVAGATPGETSIAPAQAARVAVTSPSARAISARWSVFPSPMPREFSVTVTLALEPEDHSARWRILAENAGSNQLRQVQFPRLRAITAQPGECLAVPIWMGQLAQDPRSICAGRTTRAYEWNYPGELSMQCLAFWGARAGLYVACDDTQAYLKSFSFGGDPGHALGLHVSHRPEADSPDGERWALPYEVLTGVFHGDWFTAAGRYRSWATNQAWALQSRLESGIVPSWVANTALWVWNRGRSPGVLDPAVEMRKRLGLPVSVFWHWWHGCSYDAGFPEYLPPREGGAQFRKNLASAQDKGVNALVYMNQRLWGMTTASWTNEQASIWAVKSPDGEIRPEVYNTFTRQPCASMCLGTSFWRDKYAGIAQQAISDFGVNGIYMDQACLSMSCHDSRHGHPAGGGTYWVDGFKKLAAGIRLRTGKQGTLPALAGEGCGEPWLPHLDAMLSLQVSRERYAAPDGWEPIPFFQAVYHPFAVFFGNYSSLTMPPYDELWPAEFAPAEPLRLLDRKFSSQFLLEQARSFVWGQQPTIANFLPSHFQSRDWEIEYLMRLARVRARAAKYLLRGTMLAPPMIEAPSQKIDISRLSIYAGQRGGLTTFEQTVPLVIGCSWRATDGQVAVALASISGGRERVTLRVPLPSYGLRQPQVLYEITESQRRKIARLDISNGPDSEVTIELDARHACLLEFAPAP